MYYSYIFLGHKETNLFCNLKLSLEETEFFCVPAYYLLSI